MNVEIISVGTELLLGNIVNTNAHHLSQELANLGFGVFFQTVVGDNAERLYQASQIGLARSDILIFTGGLGPTEDDLTKQTVAEVFGDTLVLDKEELASLEHLFAQNGRPMAENNRKQAFIPRNGRKLANPNGTAPGVMFAREGKIAFLLPGPPSEMQPMFANEVRPLLAQMQDSVLFSRTLRVFGIGESDLEVKVTTLLQGQNPSAALYAKIGEVHIRITAKAVTKEEAEILCAHAADDFYALLGDVIYGEDDTSLEGALVAALQDKNATICTAESCTGGLLSARITSVSGASNVFALGLCTYSNDMKHRYLSVRDATLNTNGAVSPQTAAQMARGARIAGKSTYSVSITGIAGPDGGTKEKPVGLVYIAASDNHHIYVKKILSTGRSREVVRAIAANHALDMARRLVLELPMPDATLQ